MVYVNSDASHDHILLLAVRVSVSIPFYSPSFLQRARTSDACDSSNVQFTLLATACPSVIDARTETQSATFGRVSGLV